METASQSISFARSLIDSEPSLSRSSSYSVLEGSPYTVPLHVQSSFLSSDAGSSSTALNALHEGGSRGVFQWIEITAQVSQAVKVCLEQLVGPNTPGHVKRDAADVLAYVCLGRHQQCSLALLSSDINDLICQALKIAGCSDTRIVRRSTQLCVLLLLCSLHQEQESREAVFGRAERAAVVLHLCLRLVASRHLSTAGEAAACLLAPLLPLLANQAQAEAAARAVVDLLKHCVEVGGEGEGLGAWLLSEHSSSAAEEGRQAEGEQDMHTLVHPLALRPPLFSDGTSGSVVSGSSSGEGSGGNISDAVAVVACKVLHALLHTDAHSSSAAGVVVEERGLAPLVALLEGRGAATTAVQAPTVTAPEATARVPAAAVAAAASASTSVQPARSTADAILGGGTISCTATELGVWATDCLFDVMEVCSAEGAAAQVVAAGGVKALLQLLQLPHADSPIGHKALRMLSQLVGATEGQQALMNLGGLPVLAGFAQSQPELVLGTLAALCSSSAAATRASVAQCQPALCALVHAIGYPSAPVSRQAIAALQSVLDAAAPHTASEPGLAAGAGAGADKVAAPIEWAMAGEEQHQGITFEQDDKCADPDQATTALASSTVAAAAAVCPVTLRLVEAGAMQQLDGLLRALLEGCDAGTAEEFDHLRAAFSLTVKLAVASPDARHVLLHLQQQQQQQQQQDQHQFALCGTFWACAVLLDTLASPSDKLMASTLLLRLLQHCRASCAAPSTCEAQQQQQQQRRHQKGQEQEYSLQHEREGEGADVPSWVAWAAGCLADTLPTGDGSSPLTQTQQKQQLQQQHELHVLLGTAEALEMIPLGSADTVFAEDACSLRQLTHTSTLLTPPPSHPFFSAACAGVPHTLLSHAFALVQQHAKNSSTARRAWGCMLLQITAPGLAAALTAETPHPSRHTLRLGLQAVECAMALCSSCSSSSSTCSSSSDGKNEHSDSNGGSHAAPPLSAAVLAVCNGLLACVSSAAAQGQVEQQQAQTVFRVCAYLQQQLLVRPEPWHVVLGVDAHAAGKITSTTQQCLRAVIAALSQEQHCTHFKALAVAALTMADFATKQAQEPSASLQPLPEPRAHAEKKQGEEPQGQAQQQQQQQLLLQQIHGLGSVQGGADLHGGEGEQMSAAAAATGDASSAQGVPSPGGADSIVLQGDKQQHPAGVEGLEKVAEEVEARRELGEGAHRAYGGEAQRGAVKTEKTASEEQEEEEDGRIEDLQEHVVGVPMQSSMDDEVQEGEFLFPARQVSPKMAGEKVEEGEREARKEERAGGTEGSEEQGKGEAQQAAGRQQGVAWWVGHGTAENEGRREAEKGGGGEGSEEQGRGKPEQAEGRLQGVAWWVGHDTANEEGTGEAEKGEGRGGSEEQGKGEGEPAAGLQQAIAVGNDAARNEGKHEAEKGEGREGSEEQGRGEAERAAGGQQAVAVPVGHDAAKAIFDILGVEISPHIDAETAEDLVMGILSFEESEDGINLALGILKDILETLRGGAHSGCAAVPQALSVESTTQDSRDAIVEKQQAEAEAQEEACGAEARQRAEELEAQQKAAEIVAKQGAGEFEASKVARITKMQAADARAHELQQELLGIVEQWQVAAALEQELRQELREAPSAEDLSAAMLNGLSTRELKIMLQERGVECAQALEKGELVQALVQDADMQRGAMARYHRDLCQRLQQAVKAQRQAERRRLELKQQLQAVLQHGGADGETESQEQVQQQEARESAERHAAAAAAAAQQAVQQRRTQAREARVSQLQRRQQQQQQQRLHQQQQQRQRQLHQQRLHQQQQRQQPLQQMRQQQLRQREMQQQRQQQRFEFQLQQQQQRQQRQQQRQEQRQQQQQQQQWQCGGAGVPGWGRFMFGAMPGGRSERGGGVAEVLAEGVAEGVAEGLAEARRFCSSFRF